MGNPVRGSVVVLKGVKGPKMLVVGLTHGESTKDQYEELADCRYFDNGNVMRQLFLPSGLLRVIGHV